MAPDTSMAGFTDAPSISDAPSSGVFLPGVEDAPVASTGMRTACGGILLEAENLRRPADIIFALDTSGSMDEEARFVQENMNAFSRQIVEAAVDARVIVISSYPDEENGICIDTPLGSGACPEEDTRLPNFLHVDEEVGSHDALERILELFPQYRSVLRADAQQHVVVVTDDESNMPADEAYDAILALDPPLFGDFIFHGIFAFTDGDDDECEDLAEEAGAEYADLVERTRGVAGDLCLQDFEPVFDRLAQAVVVRSGLPCEWALPPPPPGTVFDATMVNVLYSSSTRNQDSVSRASSAGECENAAGGWAWHFDDEARPSTIQLCAGACAAIQDDAGARVGVEFGCPSRVVLR